MKKLLLLLGLIVLGCEAFAFNIVYPKKSDVTINAKSTFFIGSSDKPITVNGVDVPLHPTGAFAYVINLSEGKNVFTVQSGDERKIFVITRPVVKSMTYNAPKFVQYENKKYFYVTTEDAPLRSTSVDAGINRIAHLQRNIPLIVDGEKSGFYRVVLDGGRFGWISKTNVKEFSNFVPKPAEVLGYDYEDSKNYFTFIYHLTRQVPFEIKLNTAVQNQNGQDKDEKTFVLNFFNTKDGYSTDFPYTDASGTSKLFGYSGHYEGNDFIFRVRKPAWNTKKASLYSAKYPLKNVKIAIDAGHGGYELGAVGCLGDFEKDITLKIAKYLQAELKHRGADVFMTRQDDIYVGLKDRVDNSNIENATVLLSIHGNALPDGADPNKHSGTSVYYYYDQAKPLAEDILTAMTSQLGLKNDRVRQASFAMVRNTNALSVLIETAYLINPDDNAKLVSDAFQKACAKAIADALEKYFVK